MKSYTTMLILIMISMSSIAQQTDSTAIKILENKETIENSMKLSGKYITQFSNMQMNFVSLRVQNYMEDNGYLIQPDLGKFNMQGSKPYITNVFISRYSNSMNPKKIYMKYFIKPLGENAMYITSCQIYGNIDFVIDFFLGFWKSTLNFEDCKKGEVVYNYFLSDRAGLSVDIKTSSARILIEKIK